MKPATRTKTILGAALTLSAALIFLLARHSLMGGRAVPAAPLANHPTAITIAKKPHHVIHTARETIHIAPVVVVADQNSMSLGQIILKRKYTYTFEGTATYNNAPCASASVLVRVTTEDGTHAVGGVTNADGTYSIQVPVIASINEPIDFTIEGYTPEFKQVEMAGRRIVSQEDDQVTVDRQLAFLSPSDQSE